MVAPVAVTLACSGLAAAQASAATVTVGQPCVVNPNPAVGSPMTVTGAGFTPGDSITLSSNRGGAYGQTPADATGRFTINMPGPILPTINPASAAFVLTATDNTDGITASTPFAAANLAVATNPAQGKPSKRVTWSFSGFVGGANIYAHYLHGKKVTATANFGRAQGPCGTLKKRAVFYPGKAKYDVYKVQVDDSRRYLATSLPRLVATLRTHIHL
ncbi:MAG TPA: hypothetical protein VG295_13835 [Solirubrobacteraceae bacterium]|jgi:hypothetical protein|nr:hypothetical protein [Solirubrobacteraceae bacterium]